MTSTARSILGSVLILLSTLSLSFIVSYYTKSLGWVDLTDNDRYTLTEGTKNILKKISRPLTAKLFFSQETLDELGTNQVKQFLPAHAYARDLLNAFVRESGGKLKFEEYDPVNFSEAAEECASLGITIQPVMGNFTFAFGLAVTSETGAKEVIKFINPTEEGLFEYKVTKLIERAMRPKKKKIGILSSLNLMGDNLSREMEELYRVQRREVKPKWNFVQWLETDHEVESVDPKSLRIDDSIDFLIAIHPKDFPDTILYAIDQFVMRGGKLIAMADPFCILDQPQQTQRNPYAQFSHPRASNFNRLLSKWGVEMQVSVEKTGGDKPYIMGDRELAPTNPQGGDQVMPIVAFDKECFSDKEAITQALAETAQIQFYYAGILQKTKGAKTEVTALLQTTETGGRRKFSNVDFMKFGQNPGGLWAPGDPTAASEADKEGFEELNERLSAAVRVTGKFETAFPDGLPGDDPGGDEELKKTREKIKKEHRNEAAEPSSIIVMSDCDWLNNQAIRSPNDFFQSPFSNLALLANSLDFLTGSVDLINIRSRGSERRPFSYLVDIRKKAAKNSAEKQAEIQKEIDKFQEEITKLQNAATAQNAGLARAEALKKEREANLAIIRKKRELNDVKRDSTREEEAVKSRAQYFNAAGMPLLVALIGLILWIVRIGKRSRQMQEDMA